MMEVLREQGRGRPYFPLLEVSSQIGMEPGSRLLSLRPEGKPPRALSRWRSPAYTRRS